MKTLNERIVLYRGFPNNVENIKMNWVTGKHKKMNFIIREKIFIIMNYIIKYHGKFLHLLIDNLN